MPSTSTIILALAGAAAAANNAFITNHCTYPVFVSTTGGDSPATSLVLQPQDTFTQPIAGSGASLQVRKQQGGDDNELDYTVDNNYNGVFYSLAGNPSPGAFANDGVNVIPSDSTCSAIVCAPGSNGDCPIGQTFFCSNAGQTDLTLNVC